MLSISSNKAQERGVLEQLNLLTLHPNKRRRILRGAGRKVRRESKKRISGQKDLTGKTWRGRSNGRKTRMLRKLGRNMRVHTSPNNAKVTFANKKIGQIASAHQHGVDQEMTASEAASKYGTPDYNASATRSQAKSLRQEGYRIRRNKGKGWKKPTLKWIMQNLKHGQAGLILRIFRSERKGKNKWVIPLPERSFLGQNKSELTQLNNYMLDEALRLA